MPNNHLNDNTALSPLATGKIMNRNLVRATLISATFISVLLSSTLTHADQRNAQPADSSEDNGTNLSGTIVLPVSQQGAYLGPIQRPQHGQTQERVKLDFGEPVATHGPHGEPAISRWDYENFSVYFENNLVLHSVLKHRRADEK